MYSVSEAYINKMFDQVQSHRLSGTINDIPFTGEDVIGVSYANRCSDKKVKIGSVNIGTLKMTFLNDILNRGDYYNAEITLVDSLLTGYDENDQEVWEDVPIGTFYVGDAVYTAPGMIDITAYDCLSFMDKPLTIEQTSGYIYDFCKAIETETGATFGMTREECEALPNGTAIIGPYPDNDMSTFRDLLSKIAEMVGGFGYGDREGSFKLRSFDNTSILNIGKTRRFSGAKFSDFQTRFDAISYVDVKTTGETKFIGDENGSVMELGNNPFLQYGTGTFIKERATAIYNQVQLMRYTPYEVGLLPAFIALDLGDVISFTNDYTLSTSSGAIMSVTWTCNKSFKIQCYGSNPNLRKGLSSTDHAIKGAASANREGRIATFTATNIQQLEIDSTKKKILSTLFTTASTNPMLTLTEVKFDLDSAGTVEVYYQLDNEEYAYFPVETYSEAGVHTLSLMFPIQVENTNLKHTFSVYMKTSSGLTIDPEYARIYIQGTGFDLTGEFDGSLVAEDELTLVSFSYLEPIEFTETVVLDAAINNDTYSVSETIEKESISSLEPINLTETVNIVMRGGFKRITEDGYQRITEDNHRRITE